MSADIKIKIEGWDVVEFMAPAGCLIDRVLQGLGGWEYITAENIDDVLPQADDVAESMYRGWPGDDFSWKETRAQVVEAVAAGKTVWASTI